MSVFGPRVLLLLICFWIGSGCGPSHRQELRVGINVWPGYEFIYLAEQKGFFREEGVPVRLLEFNSLADARRAFEHGQIDGLGTTVVEVLQSRNSADRKPTIVRVVDASDGADMILARNGIEKMAGLKGKKIGVELASLGIYVLARALEGAGLKLDDVVPVSISQTQMEEAFAKGELDAVVTYPPTSVKMLRAEGVRQVFSSAEIPDEVVDVIAFNEDFGTVRSESIQAFLRAFDRAVEFWKTNRKEANAIMARREGITPEEFDQALTDGLKLYGRADQRRLLAVDGPLQKVLERTDRTLRSTRQISGEDRRAGAATMRFVDASP